MKFIAATAAMVLSGAAYAGEAVDYSAGDRTFEGYVAKAENPKGAVVLIHDWDGLTDYEKKRADMLAEQGYNAFAIDLYGKGVRPGWGRREVRRDGTGSAALSPAASSASTAARS